MRGTRNRHDAAGVFRVTKAARAPHRESEAPSCLPSHPVPGPKTNGLRTREREANKSRAPLSGAGGQESEGRLRERGEDGWRVPRSERTTERGWRGDLTKAQKRRLQRRPREATWAPRPGFSDRREGEAASGARGRSRRVSPPGGARGPGAGAGRVGHLYCLKSWSDSLKPLLSSMLMPARASSASCRGAAAAAAESPSSCRRGRCCSEPAMGARGCAQGRGEVGRQLLRPPRSRSPALPARSAAQPSGAGEGRRRAGRAGAGRGGGAGPAAARRGT